MHPHPTTAEGEHPHNSSSERAAGHTGGMSPKRSTERQRRRRPRGTKAKLPQQRGCQEHRAPNGVDASTCTADDGISESPAASAAAPVLGTGTHGRARRTNSDCRVRRHRCRSSASGAGASTHGTTLCMNPYVRCVRLANTVPEIRSLRELLAVHGSAAPVEADTPCLRPSDGPRRLDATRRASPAHSTPTHAALVAARVQDDVGSRGGQEGRRSPAAAATSAAPSRPSPELSFTVDGVATPNTFATVSRHQKRMIAAAANAKMAASGKPPSQSPLQSGPEESLAPAKPDRGEAAGAAVAASASVEGSVVKKQPQKGEAAEEGDLCAVDMRLPSSTVDIAIVAPADRSQDPQQLERRSNCVACGPDVHTRQHRGSEDESMPLDTSSSSSYERVEVPCPDVKQSTQNERIISPHSLELSEEEDDVSNGEAHATTARATRGRSWKAPGEGVPPSKNGKDAAAATASPSSANLFPEKIDAAERQERESRPSHVALAQRPAASPSSAAALVPGVHPVARIEGSPYHYIMRNFVGGTFLYYSTSESKQYFLEMCYKVIEQVTPILERETVMPSKRLFPTLAAPAYVLGDVHGNFADLAFFLQQIIPFHDFNLTPANLLCLGDYVDRGAFSLECVILLFSLKIMNADKLVLLRGNHEDRVVCGDLQTYGLGCFVAQCQTVFGYVKGMHLFRAVTALFRYLPLACELVVPYAPDGDDPPSSFATPTARGPPHLSASHKDLSSASGVVVAAELVDTAAVGGAEPFSGGPGVHGGEARDERSTHRSSIHENLYVRQVCVPLQPTTPPQGPASATLGAQAARVPPADVKPSSFSCSLSSFSCSSASSRSSSAARSSASSPSSSSTVVSHDARRHAHHRSHHDRVVAPPRRPGGGGALYPHTHEERVLCTHGGIPRFFAPPLQDDALSYLRSLQCPRLLTVFPSNATAMADPECAPDFYNRHLKERLKRQHLRRPACGCFCDGCVDEEDARWRDGHSVRRARTPSHLRRRRQRRRCPRSRRSGVDVDSTGTGCGCHVGCTYAVLPDLSSCADGVSTEHASSGGGARDDNSTCGRSSSSSNEHTAQRQRRAAATSAARPSPPPPPPSLSNRTLSLEEAMRRGWFIAFDLMWSDPTPTEPPPPRSHTVAGEDDDDDAASRAAMMGGDCGRDLSRGPACVTNEWGFGINTRGSNVVSYSAKAVETFLTAYDYAMLIRAHQEKTHGLRWSKNKRVLTVFSSSNYLGHGNGAGCVILTAQGEVQMIEKLSDGHP